MFKLLLNDRELRTLARILGMEGVPNSDRAALARKVSKLIDDNLDALERIDAHEAGEPTVDAEPEGGR